MAVTQKEIARRAGVSCATVSRVIRDPSLVRRQLAQQVWTAMRELGVEPRDGELAEHKRNDLLVVVNDFTYSLYGGVFEPQDRRAGLRLGAAGPF